MNRLNAFLLLATLSALVVWAGQLVGGTTGMVLASVHCSSPASPFSIPTIVCAAR